MENIRSNKRIIPKTNKQVTNNVKDKIRFQKHITAFQILNSEELFLSYLDNTSNVILLY